MFKLGNVIQNYAWGSTTAMSTLFGINNPSQQPLAEMWMGAHPNGCSRVVNNGDSQLLSDLIEAEPEKIIGRYTYDKFGELPYLLKVLCADKPLSIQVHPEKRRAEQGFARENAESIPLDAPERNYKDANHKPELVYAITNYLALNGFRIISDIVTLFEQARCNVFNHELARLKANPTPIELSEFFRSVVSLHGEQKTTAIAQLMDSIEQKGCSQTGREAFSMISEFAQDYPNDVGLFAPLLLNIIELQAGEAMFLHAETPHAYVKGTGIEIMANSDNVLRVGLTPKHVDVDELIKNTRFEPIPYSALKTTPLCQGNKQIYSVPVDDFKFEVLTAVNEQQMEYVRSAEILFCLQGEITVCTHDTTLVLTTGESAFIEEQSAHYYYYGHGSLVRAFN